ncbi:MAG: DUF4364 family protein [Clostridia bacterium]|nr:DUF4364 family protein [Clostridia bacterium]
MEKVLEYTQDSTINKLKLLFLLDKMEIPLTENNIIDICTSRNNWINYMDCKEILWQLLEVGFIYKNEADNDECRYGITVDGRNCLSHFFLRIPQSLREEISTFIKENKLNLKRSQEYVSDYVKNPDGSHTVTLKIKEPVLTSPLLEIKLKAPNRHAAITACKKWKENAANIFEYLYDTIIDN